MKTQYYFCNDLDELEAVQQELLAAGFHDNQVHILSDDDAGVTQHHLHGINSFMKTNIIHATFKGLAVGLLLSATILLSANLFSLHLAAGWAPVIFLALIAIGISTWEGGLWGIQHENSQFAKLEDRVHHGEHALIVNYDQRQGQDLYRTQSHHPHLAMV
ncbi:MAG: magnesium transporter, partial [Pseudomonadales bacterium]|nr:magnesium transporter [Pseudomonadales bacterium]